jgi:hypothetical protein
MKRALVLLSIAVAGCLGSIGESGGGDEDPNGPSTSPATQATPLSLPLRPLTPFELARTLEDLFDDRATEVSALQPAQLRTPSEQIVGPETIWSGARADLLEEAMFAVAGRIAHGKLAGCADDACLQAFFASALPALYRRPIEDADTTKLVTAVHDLEPKLGRDEAMARAVEMALMSPDFLYLPAFGDPSRPISGGIELAPYELASRLSYLVWASAPDAKLLEAAKQDDLRTDAAIERETRRLLADPRAGRGIARFVHNWTGEINLASKPHADPAWTSELASDALSETSQHVSSWFTGSAPAFSSLLVSNSAFVSPNLASFYGPGAPGRVGLFTQASFLATHSTNSASSPTLRGKWFMERALCHSMGSPPANAAAMAPAFEPWMQTRDWHEKLQGTKGCNNCHGLMEPPGYVYEGFDAIGRARTTERDKPVRTNATLATGTDMDGTYAGPADFMAAASKSPTVRACFASNWLSHALGRGVNDAELPLIAAVSGALETDAREALVLITTSPAFRRAAKSD